MSRTVRVAVSGPASPWTEVGRILQRALRGRDYDLELIQHGDLSNARAVTSRECEIGVTMSCFFDWAARRVEYFAGEPFPELRVIAAVYRPSYFVAGVVRSSGISSLRQLGQGKYPWKVMIVPSDAGFGVYIDSLLRGHGFSREDVTSWGGKLLGAHTVSQPFDAPRRPGEVGSARELAQQGEVDGFFNNIYWTAPWARQITSMLDVKFLQFDEAVVDAVVKEHGGEKLTFPAWTFPGVDEDIVTVGFRQLYVYGPEDADADLVRALTTALDQAAHGIQDNAHGVSYAGVPHLLPGLKLHPAAEEYYRSRS